MMLKYAVIYSHVPRYRVPVFTELLQSKNVKFELYYSKNVVGPSIRSDIIVSGSREVPIIKFGPFFLQTSLFKVILSRDYDGFIFLSIPYDLSTYIYPMLARLNRKKVLFWTHGWLKQEFGLKKIVRNAYHRIPHALLLYGERARNIGVSNGFEEEKLRVIYNSLDYEVQERHRRLLESDGKKVSDVYFVCVARITQKLNANLILDALSIASAELGKRLSFKFVGVGDQLESLRVKAARLNLEVEFLGEIYDETALAPLIYNARAMVSPGKVGLTAMHSLAYGTPVISHGDGDTQMPEYEAITPGLTGDLFDKGDPHSLAKVLVAWSNKPKTDVEYLACIDVIEKKYTPKTQVKFIENAILSLKGPLESE